MNSINPMKLQIISPMPMQWEARCKEIFPDAEWTQYGKAGADVMLHMWCNENTVAAVKMFDCRHVIFVRRYEWFAGYWKEIVWSRVAAVIMVNDYLAGQFEAATGIKPHLVYNGVDPSKWTFRERQHGKNIAWVGFINQKKNLPLALQILAELPADYSLHIAGGLQDQQVFDYAVNLAPAIKRNVVFHGHVPHEHMDEWLEDKNYILSTAISEGSPNHVLEAMSKGIKPIVHNWPGAKEQFTMYVFNTVSQAVSMILRLGYDSDMYRTKVMKEFGLLQYQKVKDIVDNIMKGELCGR